MDNASPAGIRTNTIVLAFTLVAGTVVFLRLFTRLVLTRGAGFEDVCIGFAMLASIGLAVVTSEQVMHGLGKHEYELSGNDITFALQMFWASLWIYNLALTFTKLSILVQYIRIFPIRRFRCACYAMLCIVIACGGWGIFGNVFICYPINLFWDKPLRGRHCISEYIIWFTTAGLNIGQDVVILFLPLPVIRSLQISKSQKKGLITMLALGASVVAVSTIRLYSLDNIANSIDRTFDNADSATLSAVEVNVGIICACLPAMRPLFALGMPKYFSTAPVYTTVPPVDLERPGNMRTKSVSTRPGSKYSRIGGSDVSLSTRPHTLYQSSTRTASRGASMQVQSRSPSIAQSRGPSTSHSRNPSATHSRSPSISRSRNPSTTHSRNSSTVSVNIPKNITTGPFQGKSLNPLRMSPITPFAPPIALRLGRVSEDNLDDAAILAPGAYSRRPSDASISLTRLPTNRRAPRTPVSTKPLPLTPFPGISSGEWSRLTAIPRPGTAVTEKPSAERLEMVKADEA